MTFSRYFQAYNQLPKWVPQVTKRPAYKIESEEYFNRNFYLNRVRNIKIEIFACTQEQTRCETKHMNCIKK